LRLRLSMTRKNKMLRLQLSMTRKTRCFAFVYGKQLHYPSHVRQWYNCDSDSVSATVLFGAAVKLVTILA
ncbi:MAG: hypothetical protein RMM08_10380, partial [Armatimonadota bacterium]|nr:hypothetical protein [Armatimonadota bacterium]